MKPLDFSFEPYRPYIAQIHKKIVRLNTFLVGGVVVAVILFALIATQTNMRGLSSRAPGIINIVLIGGVAVVMMYFNRIRATLGSDIWWMFAKDAGAIYEQYTVEVPKLRIFSNVKYYSIHHILTFQNRGDGLKRIYFCDVQPNNGVNIQLIPTPYLIFEYDALIKKGPSANIPSTVEVEDNGSVRSFVVAVQHMPQGIEAMFGVLAKNYLLVKEV